MWSTPGASPHPALRAAFPCEGKEDTALSFPEPGKAARSAGWGQPVHRRAKDSLDDRLKLMVDLVVPEAKDAKAGSPQNGVALSVACKAIGKAMLPAINLDHQLRFQAREVDHEAVQRHLPSDMGPLRPELAKL